MLEERGVVVAVGPDGVWVETRRKSACGECAQRSGCGTGALSGMFNPASSRFQIDTGHALRVGDEVLIGLEERALLRGSVVVYLLPLLLMFFSAVAGQALGGGEGFTLLAGGAGLVGGLFLAHRFSRRAAADARYRPVLLEKL